MVKKASYLANIHEAISNLYDGVSSKKETLTRVDLKQEGHSD